MVRIKHILIDFTIVINGTRVSVKEGKVRRETGIIVKTYEGIDIDSECSTIVAQELDNVHHEVLCVCPEVTIRRFS